MRVAPPPPTCLPLHRILINLLLSVMMLRLTRLPEQQL